MIQDSLGSSGKIICNPKKKEKKCGVIKKIVLIRNRPDIRLNPDPAKKICRIFVFFNRI